MDMVDLILTVCLAASPDQCRDEHLYFESPRLPDAMHVSGAKPEIVKWSDGIRPSRSCAGNAHFPARKSRSECRSRWPVLGGKDHDGFATPHIAAGRTCDGVDRCGKAAPRICRRPVRIGVLKFGTVSWELDTLKHHGFDAANGVALEVIYFAGEDATNVAMLAGEIDMMVTDWLWVSRQRSDGVDLTLAPYSTAVGAIMVRQEFADQHDCRPRGKKIGVAGGPLDKSWLLIQAAGQARPWHRPGGKQRNRFRRAAR